jgi:hypothetical protein
MNEVNALLAEVEGFKFVVVTFPNSDKQYTYKTTFDVEVDDRVIVDSPFNGLVVVTVIDVKSIFEVDHDVSFRFKWIVQKVDTKAYEKAEELESTLLQAVNKAKVKQRVKELNERLAETIGEDEVKAIKGLVRL